MQLLKIDKKNNFFEVVPDNMDDLWHLERIIETGDVVSAKTERKVKPREEGMQATKENVFYDIQAEKIEFHESSGHLRVLGVIVGGHPEELVELKAHHSIDIFPEKSIKVKKSLLKNHQIDRLKQAQKASGRGMTLLVVLDDEAADFAVLKEFGFEQKGKIASGKSGKQFKSDEKENLFFEKIIKKVQEIAPEKTVIAGPGFTKTNLKKFIDDKRIKLPAFFEHTNSTGITGLNELIKDGTIDKIVSEMQIVKETKLVEQVLAELGKQHGLAVVSFAEVEKAVLATSVAHLLLGDVFLLSNREKAEKILSETEQAGGEIHIVSSKSDAGKKLNGLGGVAALLRFRAYR